MQEKNQTLALHYIKQKLSGIIFIWRLTSCEEEKKNVTYLRTMDNSF